MFKSFRKEQIPWMMAGSRTLLGPVLIAGQRANWNSFALAGIVLAALLSDIYDGVLARRWSCDTRAVRVFDSLADTFFYLCTGIALWIGQPRVCQRDGGLLLGLVLAEALKFGLDFWKYGRPASYHSYLAKSFGLVLAAAVIGTFAQCGPAWLLPLALGLGIASNLEGVAMTAMLPVRHVDVKTLRAAWLLRSSGSRDAGKRVFTVVRVATVLVLALSVTATALAAADSPATYRSGTTQLAAGSSGRFEMASPTNFLFRPKVGAPIDIAYSKVQSVQYTSEVAYHLGFLPMIAVGLLKNTTRRHLLSITYADAADVPQVAVFELPKNTQGTICAVLHARTPAGSHIACPVTGGE